MEGPVDESSVWESAGMQVACSSTAASRKHTSAYVSIRQHASAYVSIYAICLLLHCGVSGLFEHLHKCILAALHSEICTSGTLMYLRSVYGGIGRGHTIESEERYCVSARWHQS